MGYDPEKKAEVTGRLASLGASILTPVPSDHYLVRARPADIDTLLNDHSTATAVSVAHHVLAMDGHNLCLTRVNCETGDSLERRLH